jgi:S1-C subfamily serine protease
MRFNFLRRLTLLVSLVSGALFTMVATAQTPTKSPRSAQLESAVVKIFSTARAPDPFKPWQKAAPSESTGSGVVIEGNRILTNAHVVSYASKVEVRAKEGGDKISAKVIAIASGIDLAVLELEDNSFFANRPPPPHACEFVARSQRRSAGLRLPRGRQFALHYQGHRLAH